MLEKAAQGGWSNSTYAVEEGMANLTASCKDPEEQYMKVFRSLWRDQELHRARIHKNLLELFVEIFGETA